MSLFVLDHLLLCEFVLPEEDKIAPAMLAKIPLTLNYWNLCSNVLLCLFQKNAFFTSILFLIAIGKKNQSIGHHVVI